MDRTYVAQQHKTPVFQLGLDLWRDHVVHNKHIKERLLVILADLIHRERTGEIIDRSLIRSTTQVSAQVAASAPQAGARPVMPALSCVVPSCMSCTVTAYVMQQQPWSSHWCFGSEHRFAHL